MSIRVNEEVTALIGNTSENFDRVRDDEQDNAVDAMLTILQVLFVQTSFHQSAPP